MVVLFRIVWGVQGGEAPPPRRLRCGQSTLQLCCALCGAMRRGSCGAVLCGARFFARAPKAKAKGFNENSQTSYLHVTHCGKRDITAAAFRRKICDTMFDHNESGTHRCRCMHLKPSKQKLTNNFSFDLIRECRHQPRAKSTQPCVAPRFPLYMYGQAWGVGR
jgi:hypothetical protein